MKKIQKGITIGIIGGAGPTAAFIMGKKIIENCQYNYHCVQDADFPKVILTSIPFAQMLRPGTKAQKETEVMAQLEEGLTFLMQSSVDYLIIACNTLHAFLKNKKYAPLLHLVEETKRYIESQNFSATLVLETSTAALKSLYTLPQGQLPPPSTQKKLDNLIQYILKGDISAQIQLMLQKIVQECLEACPTIDSVLLGCTELSVLMAHGQKTLCNKVLIDPVHIIIDQLCEKIFI